MKDKTIISITVVKTIYLLKIEAPSEDGYMVTREKEFNDRAQLLDALKKELK